jgi:sortase (surface protein transpeptidase)
VTEIRVVTPDQVDWAIAAQSIPSMTLQTCVGANSDHRLLVRLVAD